MSSEDQNYLSWMTGTALAVLMVVVMFWIRSQIPDAVSSDAGIVPTAAGNKTTGSDALSPPRDAIASVYECISGSSRTLSDRPCGTGAVLRHIGVSKQQRVGDVGVVHHR